MSDDGADRENGWEALIKTTEKKGKKTETTDAKVKAKKTKL
jgi:hypothetical protein